MPPSDKFKDRIGRLIDKFADLELKVKLRPMIDQIRVEVDGEDLVLSPELQDKAFDLAAREVSDRMATMFANELRKQIELVMEQDEGEVGERRDAEKDKPEGRGKDERGVGGGEGNQGASSAAGADNDGGGGTEEPFPCTLEQVRDHLSSFVRRNLGPYIIDDQVIEQLAKKVAAEGRRIQEELDITEKEVLWLATISLYDIAFLCDDSGSMTLGSRIPALVKTLQSVAAWATKLEPTGVSVRFLNYKQDKNGGFDNLTDGRRIAEVIHKVKPRGLTRLGNVLEDKILEHRAHGNKPLIAVIITDGGPTGEEKDRFRETIIRYKNLLGESGRKAGLVFIIFQVGKDPKAQEFLNSVAEDPELEGLIHRSKGRVDEVMQQLESTLDGVGSENGREYKRHLLLEFITAMQEQTQN